MPFLSSLKHAKQLHLLSSSVFVIIVMIWVNIVMCSFIHKTYIIALCLSSQGSDNAKMKVQWSSSFPGAQHLWRKSDYFCQQKGYHRARGRNASLVVKGLTHQDLKEDKVLGENS